MAVLPPEVSAVLDQLVASDRTLDPQFNPDGQCSLTLPSGNPAVLEWSPSAQRLLVYSPLDSLPASEQLAVCHALLCFNLVAAEEAGLRFGVGGPDGCVMLMMDLHLCELSVPALSSALLDLDRRLPQWQRYIAMPSVPQPPFGSDAALACERA